MHLRLHPGKGFAHVFSLWLRWGCQDARKGWDAARGQILGVGLRIRCTKTGTNEQTTIVDVVCAEGQDAAVRIGPPNRKHGVSDADIGMLFRTAVREIGYG